MAEETIVIKVIQAKDLPKEDLIGSIDAYFILKYGEDQHKTEVVKNDKNPTINEVCEFNYDPSKGDEIVVELYDWDGVSNDDFVATTVIKIFDFKNRKTTKWFPLQHVKKNKKTGDVQLEVVYNAKVEVAKERAFDPPSGFQQAVQDYVLNKPLFIQFIHLLYVSLTWANLITYGIVAGTTILNYFFIVSTKWKTLPYLSFLSFEAFVIYFVLSNYTKFLKWDVNEAESSTKTVINYIFHINLLPETNPLNDVKQLENFQKTPFYVPTLVTVSLLLLALISSIFSGGFLAFVAVTLFLVGPGIVTKGYDVKFVNWWVPTVWTPHLQPLYESKIKPQIEKVLSGKAASTPSDAPASS